jgi:hypothetical protein
LKKGPCREYGKAYSKFALKTMRWNRDARMLFHKYFEGRRMGTRIGEPMPLHTLID